MEGKHMQFCFGLMVVAVLALVVIAMSVHKMSSAKSGFADTYKASLPFMGERTDSYGGFLGSNNNEAPVFWNMGDMSQINKYLADASKQPESDMSGFYGKGFNAASKPLDSYKDIQGFSSKKVGEKINKIAQAEQFVGTGL